MSSVAELEARTQQIAIETPPVVGQVLGRRVAAELYQQINYIEDIRASSQAVAAALAAMESETLDNNFAEVNTGLLAVADEVARGVVTSLDACRRVAALLSESAESFRAIQEAIGRLIACTQRIQGVADIIQGFAQQTALVAINARIEAAHAGKFGAAFGVVADEVSQLAGRIREASASIGQSVAEIVASSRETAQLVDAEIGRSRTQDEAVATMVRQNERLMTRGRTLPGMVDRLDQFLEPLESARSAIGHNRMILVAGENLGRNLRGLHAALRRALLLDDEAVGGGATIESFTERLAEALTRGVELPIERMLNTLLQSGVPAEELLEATARAVQAANMRQKQQHVSVGDYYVNFLLVERAMSHLRERLPQRAATGMRVVIGNAFGDYHGLGREMVALFLRAAGIEVLDVGLGAEASKFVQAARESRARVVGVSSLLVESAKQITRIRQALDRAGLSETRIVAGGACFTVDPELYREVGADYVATAASDMISIVHRVYGYVPLAGAAS